MAHSGIARGHVEVHRWFAIFAWPNGNTADCVVRRTADGNAGRRCVSLSGVMPVPGLDPGIVAGTHVFLAAFGLKDVDGRVKPGHDSE
jgi:hypothetical protein